MRTRERESRDEKGGKRDTKRENLNWTLRTRSKSRSIPYPNQVQNDVLSLKTVDGYLDFEEICYPIHTSE